MVTHDLSRLASALAAGALSFIITTAVLLQFSTPVAASNFPAANGKTGCGYLNRADNKTHSFGWNDLELITAWNHSWVQWNRVDPTALTAVQHNTITAKTDAVALDKDYSSYCNFVWHSDAWPYGYKGLTVCYSLTPDNVRCQKHQMRYDLSYVNGKTDQEVRGLIMHEVGHSVGLDHRSNEIMKPDVPYAGYSDYSAHDKNHFAEAW